MLNLLRKTYDKVISYADRPEAPWVLFIVAFTESSFFPIPPDVLLIAMAIAVPANAFRYALICSVGSVLGGMFGYVIGVYLMESVGKPIIEFYGVSGKYDSIQSLYRDYDAMAVFLAGFTPIPYKVFTIAAGAFKINLVVFVIASIVSRSIRFYMLAWLINKYGEGIKIFIEKYFNIITIIFSLLLIGGFILIKYLF